MRPILRFPPTSPPNAMVMRHDPALKHWLDAQVGSWECDECVVLPKVAVDAMRTVANWRRGPNVMQTIVPPGTPVASFIDRTGKPSRYWDGCNGLGIAGNRTTHPGIVAAYRQDVTGVLCGLTL